MEDRKYIPKLSYLTPDLALRLTLSGSKYSCLEQISIIFIVFEPVKFDYTYKVVV